MERAIQHFDSRARRPQDGEGCEIEGIPEGNGEEGSEAGKMGLRLTTWNVNGIRNPFGYAPWNKKRTLEAMFDILEADIVVFQECKIQPKDLDDQIVLVPGWDSFFSLPVHRKGYSGVAIYTRQSKVAPIRAEQGITGFVPQANSSMSYHDLPADQQIGGYPTQAQLAEVPINNEVDPKILDSEGRCVILEFPAFVLIGTYVPADSDGSRPEFRQAFIHAVDCRIRNLIAMGKRVIWAGDLNMTRAVMDSADYREQLKKGKMTQEDYLSSSSRRVFNQLLEDGDLVGPRDSGREEGVMVDVPRIFHSTRPGMYTHWDSKKNLRPANFGSRIDHILASSAMKDWFADSNIQEGLAGSDHCPAYANFKDRITIDGQDNSTLDLMNLPGDFKDGERQRPYDATAAPALSGRQVYKEFSKRQSIKTMFMAKRPALKNQPSGVDMTMSAEDTSTATASTVMENGASNTQSVDPNVTPETTTPQISAPELLRSPVALDAPGSQSNAASAVDRNKRKASETSSTPATKKAKSKKDEMKGQGKLSAFFLSKSPSQPTEPTASVPPSPAASTKCGPSTQTSPTASTSTTQPDFLGGSTRSSTPKASATPANRSHTDGSPDTPPSATAEQDTPPSPPFIDPVASKEGWSTIMRTPPAPRCQEHDEPCALWQTKKKGANQGRWFYMCCRNLGPSGHEEANSEWRCKTWIWKSDWVGGEGGRGRKGDR